MRKQDNKVAIVTGASRGIGAAIAERLAKDGFTVAINYSGNAEPARALAAKIEQDGGKAATVKADVADTQAVRGMFDMVEASFGGVDVLVNNAGVGATAPLLGSDIDKMAEMISINVNALTRLTYAAVPGFVARGGGSIINIASIVAVGPEILNGVYGGSKAFVLAFSQSLRHELKDKNVKIQVVLPGATATDFWELAGTPVKHLPTATVMRADDMVDAALAGFDQEEFVTIPSLPDAADWEAYEAARQKLLPNLSRSTPAARYKSNAAA
jgi:short-subunit dehydrogenase